jgi:hypothetical protein
MPTTISSEFFVPERGKISLGLDLPPRRAFRVLDDDDDDDDDDNTAFAIYNIG